MRGGFFGARRRCFAGDFGVVARRGWAVLPRNFGGFGLGEGSAQLFSARRTLLGSRGEKIFKKGVKNRKIGVREVLRGLIWAPYIGLGVSSLTVGHHPIRLL